MALWAYICTRIDSHIRTYIWKDFNITIIKSWDDCSLYQELGSMLIHTRPDFEVLKWHDRATWSEKVSQPSSMTPKLFTIVVGTREEGVDFDVDIMVYSSSLL